MLTPADAPEVRELLSQDPVTNLFLLDKVDKTGLSAHSRAQWHGARDATGRLQALAYTTRAQVGRPADTVVPWGDAAHAEAIGERIASAGGTRMMVGPRSTCDGIWRGLGRPEPRRHHDQRLFLIDRLPQGTHTPVGRATLDDVDVLTEMEAGMLGEDLGISRADLDMDILRRRTREKVLTGTAWVAREGGRIVFVVHVGFRTPLGAQVGGTFVWPADRGRGVATRSMRGIVRTLLGDGVPRITLHADEANAPAIRCYTAAGFQPHAPFRLMVL